MNKKEHLQRISRGVSTEVGETSYQYIYIGACNRSFISWLRKTLKHFCMLMQDCPPKVCISNFFFIYQSKASIIQNLILGCVVNIIKVFHPQSPQLPPFVGNISVASLRQESSTHYSNPYR